MHLVKISPLLVLCILGVAQAHLLPTQTSVLRDSAKDDPCKKQTEKLVKELQTRIDRLEKELKQLTPALEEVVFKVLDFKYSVLDMKDFLKTASPKSGLQETYDFRAAEKSVNVTEESANSKVELVRAEEKEHPKNQKTQLK